MSGTGAQSDEAVSEPSGDEGEKQAGQGSYKSELERQSLLHVQQHEERYNELRATHTKDTVRQHTQGNEHMLARRLLGLSVTYGSVVSGKLAMRPVFC